MNATDKKIYALFPHTKLIAKQNAIGMIFCMYTFMVTAFCFTPGSIFVVRDKTCVNTVAKTICQAVKKKGYENPHVDRIALFIHINVIDRLIHIMRYNHVGAMLSLERVVVVGSGGGTGSSCSSLVVVVED